MSQPTLDPTDFAARIEHSFGDEPGHAAFEDDLRVARRRLRRHRVNASLGGAAVAAVAASALFAAPGLLPHRATDLQAASAPLTDADVVRDCVGYNDWADAGASGDGTGDDLLPRARVVARMGGAELMTRADSGEVTVATVRSQDGAWWIECTLSRREPAALKAFTHLYPTAVRFPRATVDGVAAYRPQSESDPRLEGTATPGVPNVQVTCDVAGQEETRAYDLAASRCPTYRITWNDRRPADVAAATVVAPDGTVLHADVERGYVSLASTGKVTPEMARTLSGGEMPHALRVTFYDKDGHVLVVDRDPGHFPVDGHLAMANFPSLAWWLKD